MLRNHATAERKAPDRNAASVPPLWPTVLTSNPVMYAGWSAAFEQALAGIQRHRAVMLVGPTGSGKTTLLEMLVDTLRREGHAAELLRPTDKLSESDTIILMDNAHLLPASTLRALMRRSSGCVMAAPDAPLPRRVGLQRPALIVEVPLLPLEETAAFVAAVLNQTGESQIVILPAAVTALGRHGSGLPGRLQAVTRLSVFLARLDGTETVQAHHVEQAATVDNRVDDDDEYPDLAEDEIPPVTLRNAKLGPDIRPGSDVGPDRDARPKRDAGPGRRGWPWRVAIIGTVCGLAVLLLPLAGGPRHEAPPPPHPAPAPVVAPPVAVPASPAPLPLPAATPLHVTILFEPGYPATQDHALKIARTLKDHGIAVADPQPQPLRSARLELTYFFAEDAAAVKDVTAALGGETGEPRMVPPPAAALPRPGSIEIHVPPDLAAWRRKRGG